MRGSILILFLCTCFAGNAQVNVAVVGDYPVEPNLFNGDTTWDTSSGNRSGEWIIYFDSARTRVASHFYLTTEYAQRFDTSWYRSGQMACAWVARAQYCGTCVSSQAWLPDGTPEFSLLCNADSCTVKWYYPSGALKEVAISYIKDSVRQRDHYFVEYYENGQMKNDPIDRRKGARQNIRTYYASGKIKEEYSARDGYECGKYREYYESGKLKSKGRHNTKMRRPKYSQTTKNGKWLYYDEEGKVIREERYRKGMRVKPKESSEPEL